MGFFIRIPSGKPPTHLHFPNPPTCRGKLFTTRLPDGQEVNGNFCINVNSVSFVLPSALADSNDKFLLIWALATSLFVFFT